MANDGFPYPVNLPGNFSVEKDDQAIAKIMAKSDAEVLAGVPPERMSELRAERDNAVHTARVEAAIREAMFDCSTTDFYNISEDGVANLAFIAARAALAVSADYRNDSPPEWLLDFVLHQAHMAKFRALPGCETREIADRAAAWAESLKGGGL